MFLLNLTSSPHPNGIPKEAFNFDKYEYSHRAIVRMKWDNTCLILSPQQLVIGNINIIVII